MSKSNVIRPRSTSYNTIEDEVDIDEEAIDTGLIRCICNSSEDDGFTIQCERCLVWQHAFCVKISQNNIPEHYLCDQCGKKINNSHRGHHKAWRDQVDQFNKTVENDVRTSTVLDRKHQHQQRRHQHQQPQPQSDFNNNNTSSSNGLNNNSNIESNSKHHFRDIHNRMGGDEDTKLSRKKNPVGRPPKRPKLSKKISVSKRSLQELELQDESMTINKNNTHHDGGSPRKRRQENIGVGENSNNSASSVNSRRTAGHNATVGSSSDFQPINYNVIRSKHAKQVFKDTRERLARLEKGKGKPSSNGIPLSTNEQHQQQHSIITPHIVFEEEVIKKDSTLKTNIQPLPNKRTTTTATNDIPTHRRRQRQQQGLFANAEISQNQLVAEVHGDIILKSEYKFDPGNDFSVLGTPCAYVFFYPTIDLCIDARYRGNDTRKIRRSCHPNAELRSIVARHTPDQEIRLGIFSRTLIEKGDEITIGYGWQRGHISWKKNLEWHDCGMTDGHQVIDEEEERSSRSALARMLNYFSDEFGDCACNDANLCFIEHLKAIQSGSDERPLTTFKVPSSTSREGTVGNNNYNGPGSRPYGENSFSSTQTITSSSKDVSNLVLVPTQQQQTSRQTADNTNNHNHNTTKAEYPVSSIEDNILIDIVSTSPLVRSPVISTPPVIVSPDIDDGLDVDDDIDIGEESSNAANYAKTRRRRRHHHRRSDSDSSSSLSYYLGSDNDLRNQISGKRVRPSSTKRENGENLSKRHSQPSKVDENNNSKSKLPCKKAWVRNFMQQATASPPTTSPMTATTNPHGSSNVSKGELDNTTRRKQSKFSPTLPKNDQQKLENITPATKTKKDNVLSPSPSLTRGPTTTAVIDMDLDEDDGELSDASSASTIPIMEQDDDRLMMNEPFETNQSQEESGSNLVSDKNEKELEKEAEPSSSSLTNKSQLPLEHNNNNGVSESLPIVADINEDKAQPFATTEIPGSGSNIGNTQQQQQQPAEKKPELSKIEKVTSQHQLIAEDKSSEKQKENISVVTEQAQRQSSSEADEQKPTKVKLSLQEYLARRGTSNQGSVRAGTEGKSSTPSPSSSSPQDCSSSSRAKTEEHPWIAATSQVEVTMETRQSEAQ
ncbi:hypothetical protein INT45_011980 [Circinella minor]|uniref:SET domain-containing protein n=1 Tax=Circinella minor TaxID=1195481 RepID=A0A8H7SGT1_9FUNG|nr:hypothetical protein INT45_011980 [Circinella minor]